MTLVVLGEESVGGEKRSRSRHDRASLHGRESWSNSSTEAQRGIRLDQIIFRKTDKAPLKDMGYGKVVNNTIESSILPPGMP